MGEDALALGAGLLGPDRVGYLGAEHLDFAAVGLPQQGGDLLGKVGAVVHHRQQDAVDLELGVQLPLDLVRMRLEVLFVLGKELGMRASEMINARCGWIEYSRFGDEETVVIDIVGKGDKQRRLPLSSEQVDKISRYLAARKRPPLFEPAGKDVPLIASFRIGNKGADKEGLSRSGLYIVLHTFLEEVANDVRKKNPRDAAKLLGSSLHWLRHTFAVASLEVMPVNVVQTAMGHASVNTTTRYISPDQTEILEGFKKLKS